MYGKVVRQARRARGLTQTQLAEITGIEQTNISAIENDRRHPSAATLHQLLLGCGFELVAAAGDTVIGLPASPDDLPGDVPPEPVRELSPRTRARLVVSVLDAAEAIVRRR
jgi:transcriptional regulator with XRE-family HTH domain